MEFIREKILSLDWNKFHEVLLVRGDDFSAVGGSLKEDGLSYHCEANGDFQLSDRVPNSVDEILNIILYHFENGISLPTERAFGRSKKQRKGIHLKKKFSKEETEDAINQFHAQAKIDKRKRIKTFVLAILILLIVPPFAYISYKGELPFYYKSTSETSAVIVHHKPVRFIRHHKMLVTYSYEVDGTKYKGRFKQGKLFHPRPLRQGDRLIIEYIESEPGVSRPLSVLKK